ncbi:MAG TPA: GAF domain-containing sensor histidine kinase [Candidatus Thermoplasmatota archaeon]|nr:GAF domain-containing sensor histidine kinase [Candidatus Thermoplasmatota archaeon]
MPSDDDLGGNDVLAYVRTLDQVLSKLSVDEMLEELLARTRLLMGADVIPMVLVSIGSDWFYTAAAQGVGERGLVPVASELGAAAHRVLVENATLVLKEHELRAAYPALVEKQGFHGILGIPLIVPEQPVGAMIIGFRRERDFAAQELALLEFVAQRSAHAIAHAQTVTREGVLHRDTEKLSTFRNDLLHMASHDLQSPLTAIKLQLRVLEKLTKETGRNERAILIAARNVDRLEGLLKDFLDLARLEAGRFILRPGMVSLDALAAEATETLSGQAAERGIRLVCHPGTTASVPGDAGRLLQVFTNLLGNAVRYTKEGGTIEVTTSEVPDSVRLSIQDQGIGMTQGQIAQLFKPFSQVHGNAMESAGAGLGLYLSSLIIQEHRGTIVVESPGPGRGTTVHATLPRVARAPDPTSGARPASRRDP